MKKYLPKYMFAVFSLLFLVSGCILGVFYYFSDQLPPLSELQSYDMKTGSEVYDINDNLIHVFAVEHRRRTDLRELPSYLIDGVLAIEDRKFYSHWGIDLLGIMRALGVDLMRGSFAQGASTITQQLARNMFLTLDKQIPRKIKESMLAVRIEQNYAKDEILEMYLDKVYLGAGSYGIEAASHRLFGKEAKDLSISEAALIIGIIQLPNAYSPIRFPDRAFRRRNLVLRVWRDLEIIDHQEYLLAHQEPISLESESEVEGVAAYFIEHIRRNLERKYGTTRLFTEGLKIYTTLDFELQAYADSVLNHHLSEIEDKQEYEFVYRDFPPDSTDIKTPYLQGSAFAIDPRTGFVHVMIGGRDFNHSKFNRMTQAKRQPGSAFKPILYTAALQNRYTAATVIKDEPISFIESDTLFWAPKNYSPGFRGYTRLREALNHSINTVAVKSIVDLGPSRVVDLGRRFGLNTPLRPYYSLAIGSFEVIPMELITAYTAFANQGERVNPIFIRRVEDSEGSILEVAELERVRVIDDRTAYLTADLLKTVIDEGTGRGIRWRGYPWYAGGKTGTTDDYRDAWFIGFNSQLVLGIWAGFDDNTSLGKDQSGAVVALPSWPYIMRKAVEDKAPLNRHGEPIVDASILELNRPDGLIERRISAETGLLPKSITEDIINELFIAGTEPIPLSDSLSYNFYPTMYRENDFDSLFFDLGGKVTEIDSLRVFDLNDPNVIKLRN